jgi:hypothetical protein
LTICAAAFYAASMKHSIAWNITLAISLPLTTLAMVRFAPVAKEYTVFVALLPVLFGMGWSHIAIRIVRDTPHRVPMSVVTAWSGVLGAAALLRMGDGPGPALAVSGFCWTWAFFFHVFESTQRRSHVVGTPSDVVEIVYDAAEDRLLAIPSNGARRSVQLLVGQRFDRNGPEGPGIYEGPIDRPALVCSVRVL